MRKILLAVALFAFSVSANATDWYQSPFGSDANGGTSFTDAVFSSTRAAALMSGGDTVNVGTGTFTHGFDLSAYDKGSAGAYTIIKGTNPYGMSGTVFVGPMVTAASAVALTGNTTWFIKVQDIQFTGTAQDSVQGWKFFAKRVLFQGGPTSGNSMNVATGDNDFLSGDMLFEDCIFQSSTTGSGRYQFLIYQSTRVVVRRCIFTTRDGWTGDVSGSQPAALATSYNSGNISFQNNIALDVVDYPEDPDEAWHGAYYWITNTGLNFDAGYNEWLGNIAHNIAGSGFQNDGSQTVAATAVIRNMLMNDCTYFAMALGNGSGSRNYTIDNVTIIHSSKTAATTGIGKFQSGSATITDLIVAGMATDALDGVSATYFDDFNNGGTETGTGQVTYDPRGNGLRFYTRIESGSNLKTAGVSGGQIGAEIEYEYGTDGTFYGDSGFNTLTANALFPLANETEIKAIICNTRGFGICGTSKSLTEWVVGYGTSPYGSEAGGGEAPVVPTVTFGATVDTTRVSSARLGSYLALAGVSLSTTTIYQECSMAAEAGIGIVRINMDWDSVEASSGSFSYTNMDKTVAVVTGTAVGQCGMELVMDMPHGPTFTADRYVSTTVVNPYTGTVDAITHYPTRDMGLVRRWVTNVVGRYRPNYIRAGNESDNPAFWHDGTGAGFLPNTTNYLLYLSTVSTAAKAAHPTVKVLFSATAFPRGDTLQLLGGNPKGLYVNHHYYADLISKSLADGSKATNYMDICDTHLSVDGEGGSVTMEQVISTFTAMHSAIGVSIPLWITEYNKSLGSYTTGDTVEEEYQKANLLYRNYSIALSSGVERIFWQFFRPPLVITGLYNDPAMVDFDYTPRNAYNALQKFYGMLNGYTFAGTVNSGNVKGTKWTKGTSVRYVYGTDSGAGTISHDAYKATKINPYGQSATLYTPELQGYAVDDNYFLLDLTPPKSFIKNQRNMRNIFIR